ncbi:MAG: RNA polymerase sigma-70 factor [Chitinophagaceae bacterium]|nr:RNA polymerase sigma-70 factor [Chitinophagaceae bacterium]
MDTNAELQTEIAAGNEQAFKMFFEKHRVKLYNYLFSIVKSREIAEEIVIDVFMKIWMGRDWIAEVQNMDAFLHKVAYNKALDFLRIAARNSTLQRLVRHEMASVKEKEADFKVLEQECREIIERAILQLSPRRRKIFTLSRVEGMSYDEIAQQLHLSRNTVRNSMAEAIRSVRLFLHKNNVHGIVALTCLLESQI